MVLRLSQVSDQPDRVRDENSQPMRDASNETPRPTPQERNPGGWKGTLNVVVPASDCCRRRTGWAKRDNGRREWPSGHQLQGRLQGALLDTAP